MYNNYVILYFIIDRTRKIINEHFICLYFRQNYYPLFTLL